MLKHDVVGMGAGLIDLIAMVPKIIGAEEKVNVMELTTDIGGAGANDMIQGALLGHTTAWIGKTGDDANGKLLLETFQKKGVDTEHIIVVPGEKGATTFLALDPAGQRSIYMCPNVTNKMHASDMRERYEEVIANARLYHSEIGMIPLDAVVEGARIAHENGVKVSIDYDVDVRVYIEQSHLGTWEQYEELVSLTDIFKTGGSMITEGITGSSDMEFSAKEILKLGPELVAITLGEKGSVLANKEEVYTARPIAVDTVDSTGAGDAFMGGLEFAYLEGYDLHRMAAFANSCGAYCCTGLGAQHLGNFEQITEFMKNH